MESKGVGPEEDASGDSISLAEHAPNMVDLLEKRALKDQTSRLRTSFCYSGGDKSFGLNGVKKINNAAGAIL